MGGPSSVRVEFEDSSDGPGDEPPIAPPTSSPSNRRALVGAALLALVVVLAAVDALRPGDGETAAGTQRLAPTTTVSPAPSTTNVAPSTDSVESAVDTVPPTGESEFFNSDVVRGETGFLALLASDSVDLSPSLYRSENGTDWDRVDAQLAPFVAKGDITEIDYSNLIATRQGFALLRTRTTQDRLSPVFPAESITERLVSVDGNVWRLDDAFSSLVHTEVAAPLFHLANSFGFATNPLPVLTQSGDCEALLALAAQVFGERPLLIHRAGRVEASQVQASASEAHTQLTGALVASFASNGTYLDTPSVCGRFPGISPDFPDPVIEVIQPDNNVRQIALPADVLDTSLANWPVPSLFGTDSGLLAVFQESVWSLDIETETWTELIDLPVEASTVVGFQLIDFRLSDYRIVDERYLVGLASEATVVADLERGEVSIDLLSSQIRHAPIILYADDEVIITPSLDPDGGTEVIALP